jgi:hypothetical protein
VEQSVVNRSDEGSIPSAGAKRRRETRLSGS